MKKIIIGTENCQKCNMLKMMCPDVEKVEVNPADLLNFARDVGIQSVPFLVVIGEVDELGKVLKGDK